MDKVFVDTDIVLDLLMQRQPFYTHAARLFTLADNGKIKINISAVCFNNLNYLLAKQYDRIGSKKLLVQFKKLVNVLAVDDEIIDEALISPFPDFEDAIQYHTAIRNKIPVIITRNLRDYKKSEIPVITAEMYING